MTHRPNFSFVIKPASASTEVMRHRGLALADRLLEVAAAGRRLGSSRRDQREEARAHRIAERLDRGGKPSAASSASGACRSGEQHALAATPLTTVGPTGPRTTA